MVKNKNKRDASKRKAGDNDGGGAQRYKTKKRIRRRV